MITLSVDYVHDIIKMILVFYFFNTYKSRPNRRRDRGSSSSSHRGEWGGIPRSHKTISVRVVTSTSSFTVALCAQLTATSSHQHSVGCQKVWEMEEITYSWQVEEKL